MFDKSMYEENERRKVIAREMRLVPESVKQLLINILNENGRRSDYFQTCITCDRWNNEKEICSLVDKRPPAKIIADGCSSYLDIDCIPF